MGPAESHTLVKVLYISIIQVHLNKLERRGKVNLFQ